MRNVTSMTISQQIVGVGLLLMGKKMMLVVGSLKISNSLSLKIYYKIVVIIALLYFCWTQILRIFKLVFNIYRENMLVKK